MDRKPRTPFAKVYKKVHENLPIYSVRIDLNWRAVGTLQKDIMIWFWVGSHRDYEKLFRSLDREEDAKQCKKMASRPNRFND